MSDTCTACGAAWGAPRLCQDCGASGCSSCLGEAEGRVLLCRACRLAETLDAMGLPPDLPARYAALQAERDALRDELDRQAAVIGSVRRASQAYDKGLAAEKMLDVAGVHGYARVQVEALGAAMALVDALDAEEADHAS